MGSFYEPSLLEDYGGDYFAHVNAKLTQPDVRDINNKLVAPWNMYDVLRPGTVILALVSLHVYFVTDTGGHKRKVRPHKLMFLFIFILTLILRCPFRSFNSKRIVFVF